MRLQLAKARKHILSDKILIREMKYCCGIYGEFAYQTFWSANNTCSRLLAYLVYNIVNFVLWLLQNLLLSGFCLESSCQVTLLSDEESADRILILLKTTTEGLSQLYFAVGDHGKGVSIVWFQALVLSLTVLADSLNMVFNYQLLSFFNCLSLSAVSLNKVFSY